MAHAPKHTPAIGLHDVTLGYDGHPAVHHLSCAIAPGTLMAVVGPNGAGKSTLVKAVMGLTPRLSGSIVLDGHELTRIPVEQRVSLGLSYVPQVQNVFGGLTVLENLQVVERVPNRATRIAEMFDLFPALAARRRIASARA